MEDVYNLTTLRKPAKPRSRDLQDTNAPAIGGGAVTTVESGAAYMPDTTTTTANHARTADTATSATNANHAQTADAATTAQRARTADTAKSATSAQRAEKSATAEALQTANFNAGASGARVADDGSAEFETLTVRGFIKAAEYLINRIKKGNIVKRRILFFDGQIQRIQKLKRSLDAFGFVQKNIRKFVLISIKLIDIFAYNTYFNIIEIILGINRQINKNMFEDKLCSGNSVNSDWLIMMKLNIR